MFPESHLDLLSDERRAVAYLATVMPDGSPQVTPIWFSYENGELKINTVRGRVKEKNMSARPRVALLIQAPNETLRFIQVRGVATNATEDGAVEHIERLSQKYDGKPFRSLLPDEVRVMFTIEASSISTNE
ncbi:MAG: PPOX class F420-dependent oxidoreductase [Nitrospirae bacterium]|nr:PPOX class F420-dependent oxidoreductase [Nitrospirota bacterium]